MVKHFHGKWGGGNMCESRCLVVQHANWNVTVLALTHLECFMTGLIVELYIMRYFKDK